MKVRIFNPETIVRRKKNEPFVRATEGKLDY
jgi:hypothetical protein